MIDDRRETERPGLARSWAERHLRVLESAGQGDSEMAEVCREILRMAQELEAAKRAA